MDSRQAEQLPLWDDTLWDDGRAHDQRADAVPADDHRADAVPAEPVAGTAQPVAAPPAPAWAARVGVFDLETTGVDVSSDRIVTAHVGVLDETGAVVESHSWMADPGVEIPAGATAVHGITTERARAEGRPAAAVVAEVVAALRGLFAAGIPVVAYNAPYDFSLLKYEALRHGLTPIAAPAPVIDPLVLDKAHDRFRKGKRTLEVVAAHYAVTLTGAHDAAADAIAAGRVAQALAARFTLTATAHELHTQQIGWARTQAESLTEYFVRIGRIDPADPIDGSWPIR
ncbi:exonuclease domain-containing protein [Microbacterium sp. W1N]|uniref:exonuclease domain-containing protein n=1 Tax=Microbacterium festucae TaxID=2977531 RepID=UPI0021BE4994|nr:exonuclease domain-containing protein [Microbacterium festucae]MCT9819999.1 exonuclease domain-containing protein [Microbacterium festucae]